MKTAGIMNRVLVIALAVVLIGAMLPLGAFAGHSQVRAAPATIYVPDDHATIQAAVDAATPGDTIVVRDGIYIENVDVNKSHLTIESQNGAEATSIHAAAYDHVLDVTGSGVTVRGFSLSLTGVTLPEGGFLGCAAIHLAQGADYCILSSNVILNNATYDIPALGIDLRSDHNCLGENTISNSIIGINIVGSHNKVTSNTIIDSHSWGVTLNQCSGNIVTRNTISSSGSTGVRLFRSFDNEIYLNNFQDNHDNAYEIESANMWSSPQPITYNYNGDTYTSYLGNYWSDYTGSDADGDGVGDTPYAIVSDADNYPLMEPFENYVIGETAPATEIWNWYDLDAIRHNLSGSYILMTGLDSTTAGYAELAGPAANDHKGWEPIGTSSDPFAGTFDGQGYEIRDLFIDRPNEVHVGLFGRMSAGGWIRDVGVVDATVNGRYDVGALVGFNHGDVRSSYSTGSVFGVAQRIGGLVGYNYDGWVADSYSTADVDGHDSVGGLVGRLMGPLRNSYSVGAVTGRRGVGGLVGISNWGDIRDCYSTGSVTGEEHVGGLVGHNVIGGSVTNSYSVGSVTGDEGVGGLVGECDEGTVSNSFWDVQTSGIDVSDGGTGKTTAEMMDIATFTDTATEGLDDPWPIIGVTSGTTDSDYTWNIVHGQTYPFLGWEQLYDVWRRMDTPSMQGWLLAPDSMISDYAVASEGEIAYAIVVKWSKQDEVESYYPYLLKSTDHAATWRDITSGVKKEIDNKNLGDLQDLAMVATDGVDPDFLAVAALVDGSFHVFVSNDGGASFVDAGEVSHGGTSLVTPYVLRISPEVGVVRDIAIGGVNNAGNGVIFRTTATAGTTGGWQNATVAPYDGWEPSNAVIDVRFAPSWAEDRTILAVTATATAIHLQSGTWTTVRGWNEKADFVPAVVVKDGVTIRPELWRWTAGMALPTDYTGGNVDKRVLWVWVNYLDEGRITNTIYRVDNEMSDVVGPLGQIANEGLWLSHISYWGDINSGKAIAGVLGAGSTPNYGRSLMDLMADCCRGVHVYHNARIQNMDICCDRWTKSCKAPSGRLAMEPFYVTADKAYAVALGGEPPYDETAWSFSFDNGNNWNQLSLIDTWIDYLSDVAVSPDCNKTMLVSVNEGLGCGCDSVWLHAVNLPEAPEYSGKWLRTWHGLLQGVSWCPFPERGLLRLNPEETTGDTVYLVDRMNSTIYWNDLEGLNCWTRRSTTAVIDNIVDLAVKNASTLYILGNNGKVSMSDHYGAAPTWTPAVTSGLDKGWTIAVHGDYILVGGQDGEVSYSNDGGETFTAMTDLPLDSFVTVAFDSYFDQNDTIYAAVAQFTDFGEGDCDLVDPDGGVFMWVIGESTSWTRIDHRPSTFQLTGAGSKTDSHDLAYTGLVLDSADGNTKTSPATGGVLYASYVAEVNGEIVTGMARCATPAAVSCCGEDDWDYLTQGLCSGVAFVMMPRSLKICGGLTVDMNSRLCSIDSSEDYDVRGGRYGTVWRLSVTPMLLIVTAELPDGHIVETYEVTLEATGGTKPYTWEATGLPNGLTCSEDGVISGTPIGEAGEFTVTITVTDAQASTHSKDMGLAISCEPGDANGDGVINVLDLAWTARIIAGLEANGDTYPGADANQDGMVNVLDLAKIASIIAGLD